MASNSNAATYNPAQVIVTFGGVPILGYADGTFVQIDPNSDKFTKVVGADGDVGFAMSADNTHTVVITLIQTSLSNGYLSACFNVDKATGLGMLPLLITDLNGATLHSWPQARIVSDPSWGDAKELTDRAWTFSTGQIQVESHGGVLQ